MNMSPAKQISSAELLDRLGLTNARTLRRWREQGLIPPPEIKPNPSGRGRMSYWPASMLDRCIEIKQLLGEGRTVREVAEILESKEKTKARKRRSEPSEESVEANRGMLRASETQIGCVRAVKALARRMVSMPAYEMVPVHVVEEAIAIAGDGSTAVLVVSAEETVALRDTDVKSHLLSANATQPMLMLRLETPGRREPTEVERETGRPLRRIELD